MRGYDDCTVQGTVDLYMVEHASRYVTFDSSRHARCFRILDPGSCTLPCRLQYSLKKNIDKIISQTQALVKIQNKDNRRYQGHVWVPCKPLW